MSSTSLLTTSRKNNQRHEVLLVRDISDVFVSCHLPLSFVLRIYLEKKSLPPFESLFFVYSSFSSLGLGLPVSYLGPTISPLDPINLICLLPGNSPIKFVSFDWINSLYFLSPRLIFCATNQRIKSLLLACTSIP